MTLEVNKADALTRAKKAWYKVTIDADNGYIMRTSRLHDMHHIGAERTLFFLLGMETQLSPEELCVK